MSVLEVGQKPIVMPHYPHMMEEDTEVWTKYLKDPVFPILEVWYDVHVGTGLEGSFVGDALGTRIARGVTRKRIDVVCRLEHEFWVVEIKPRASMTALGQAISYRGLFVKEYFTTGPVFPVVVCDQLDEDLISEYDRAGVLLIING
ncbi:unnamed protein product [marine sediment metagenome]|uniref:Uncharacterized protein n=1 Tax=marine sediment metagenome TaxID=412755 RepID=X1EZA1_9ZZZZ